MAGYENSWGVLVRRKPALKTVLHIVENYGREVAIERWATGEDAWSERTIDNWTYRARKLYRQAAAAVSPEALAA